MADWKKCRLGDVITFQRGHDLSRPQMKGSTYPVAGSNGVIGYHDSFTSEAGGVTIGRSGNIGTPHFYKDRYWAHNTVLYIKDFKSNDHKFIFYFLKTLDFNQFNTGSAVPSLNRNHIHELEVTIPQDKSEQKAIVDTLSSLDDKIDLLHRQNKTLESLAETLFHQYFIEEVSDNWKEMPLDIAVNISIGRTPPRKQQEWFSKNDADIKWISIKDMGNDGAYIFKTSEYLTGDAIEKFKIPIIPKNTVVLSFKMTVGRVAITTEEMLSNEAIAHFKFNQQTPFTEEYLYLFLKNFRYDSLGSTSSIVTSINSAIIKEIKITVPCKDVMLRFSEVAKPQFNKIKENQQQIQTLEKLRDTLLPKLMSGEVKVKYSDT